MDEEECQKAMEEGTWLVYEDIFGDMFLVRVVTPGPRSLVLFTGPTFPADWTVSVVSYALRVASPNDMLKYGE